MTTLDPAGAAACGPAEVREARWREVRAISRCLGRAFEDDPVARFLFPDRTSRADAMARFYRAVIADLTVHGSLQVDSQLRGAAVWEAPRPPQAGPLRQLVSSLRLLASLRGALPRAQSVGTALEGARPERPHWYLAVLGTEPVHQRRGIGSALLAAVLDRCDRNQTLAYLESSKKWNIPFYQRHGFVVTGQIVIPGGPTLWPMQRQPAAAGSWNEDA